MASDDDELSKADREIEEDEERRQLRRKNRQVLFEDEQTSEFRESFQQAARERPQRLTSTMLKVKVRSWTGIVSRKWKKRRRTIRETT